jgi:hypothetical protein
MGGSSLEFALEVKWSELGAQAGEGLVFMILIFLDKMIAEAHGQKLSKWEKMLWLSAAYFQG